MFARAFETYVAGEIKAGVQSSDYLTYEKSPLYMATWGKSPYPMGAERTAAKEAFDKLFQTIQEKTDEKTGKQVLFSKKNHTPTPSIKQLQKAEATIKKWLDNNVSNGSFVINLPSRTLSEVRKVMGRDFDSHVINVAGIRHGLKNHGVGGKELTQNSIPIRKKELKKQILVYIRKQAFKS